MIKPERLCPSWSQKPLGKVVEFLDHLRRPITDRDRVPGPYPYYGANGQQDSVADYIFDEPLILMAEDGGYFGDQDRTIAYRVDGKCWVNNHAHVLRPKDGVDIGFLCRHLEKYDVTRFINGATRQKLNKSRASEIPIALPSLPEQKRIAAILDKADTIRRKRQQAIKLADEFLRATFLDMFGDPVTNPKGWEVFSLDSVCNKVTDGTHDTPKRLEAGITFITGKHIKPFRIDFENCDYVSIKDHKEIVKRCKPEKEDILYTNIGVNVGTAAMNTWEDTFSMKNVALLKPNKKMILSRYLEYVLNHTGMKDKILGLNSVGGAQKFLSLTQIKRIKIPIPSLSAQDKLENILKNASNLIDKYKVSLLNNDEFFNSLTQRAFRGEL